MSSDHYYYDDDDYDDYRSWWKRPGLWAVLLVVVAAAVGFVVLRPFSRSASPADSSPASAPSSAATSVSSVKSSAPTTVPRTTAASTTAKATTTVAPTTAKVTTTTAKVTTTTAKATTTTAKATGVAPGTVPDDAAASVTATFADNLVTLAGAVPSDAAKARLQALAIARSGRPVPVNNLLTVDPSVPADIGLRMLDLTSDAFGPGSSNVDAQQSIELNQTAALMSGFPAASLVVVGHGDGAANDPAGLATDRAEAVVAYLNSKGIDPSRLAYRSVDTIGLPPLDDGTSTALNGRVELLLFGLLGG